MIKRLIRFTALFAVFTVSGCSSTNTVDNSKGGYKVGKPYTINGVRYVPEEDYEYSETGIASWYGSEFHGKRTANGERYNRHELTAAHRTLPMPSIVKVTNLDNGKSVLVRVNDRGPFSRKRIIDVSERAAELLGFKARGTAKVKVSILEKESRKIAQAAMSGKDTSDMTPQEGGFQTASYSPATAADNSPSVAKLQTRTKYVVSGHKTDGLFYPDPVVTQEAVSPTHIYVQAGAFSSRENADRLSEVLSQFGEVQVKPVSVQGQMYYRVRIPVTGDDVDAADRLLGQVISAGYRNALIIVD